MRVRILVQAQGILDVPEERVDTIEPSRPSEGTAALQADDRLRAARTYAASYGTSVQQPRGAGRGKPVCKWRRPRARSAAPADTRHLDPRDQTGERPGLTGVTLSVVCSIVKDQSAAACRRREVRFPARFCRTQFASDVEPIP